MQPELIEEFRVVLEDAQGGAGLGMQRATVKIQPDGSPGGQIEIALNNLDTGEGSDGQIELQRHYYFQGSVCVTVTPTSGSAVAGVDFEPDPVQVCWEDQDSNSKYIVFPVINDDVEEELENFTIQLSNPTGGAIIGTQDWQRYCFMTTTLR